jgi:hypothetical protein
MALVIKSLDVFGAQIPVDKYYTFGNKSFLLRFRKSINGIFSVEVFDSNGEKFLFSNKLTYGQQFIDSLLAPFQDKVIPLSINLIRGEPGIDVVNEELGEEVKLMTDIIES